MRKQSKKKLTLRHRDHTILKLLLEHRFLNSELIWYLIRTDNLAPLANYSIGVDGKSRPKTYGFKRQALDKRLKQLYDAGYVERHYVTDRPFGRGHGSPRAIYGLGTSSPKILQELFDVPVGVSKKIIDGNKVKSPFLRHALEVAKFRVVLELACQKSYDQVKLLFWEQGNCLKDHAYGLNHEGNRERFTVHADAFFGIEIAGKGRRHFFLEADCGTEPIVSSRQRTDIRGKLFGYRYYRKSDSFLSRYSYRILPNGQIIGLNIFDDANLSRTMKTLRISGFQVLFVVPGRIEENVNVYGRIANVLNELMSFGKFYQATTMFWFVTPSSLNLEKPEIIFEHIFVTPSLNSLLKSLLE